VLFDISIGCDVRCAWCRVYLRSLHVDVAELHGSRGGNRSHALAGDTAGRGGHGLGAGDTVGSRISLLRIVSRLLADSTSRGTYGADDTGLEVLALEAGQKEVCSVTSSNGGSAGQQSDRVETHFGK
jgi:hypothetical protein